LDHHLIGRQHGDVAGKQNLARHVEIGGLPLHQSAQPQKERGVGDHAPRRLVGIGVVERVLRPRAKEEFVSDVAEFAVQDRLSGYEVIHPSAAPSKKCGPVRRGGMQEPVRGEPDGSLPHVGIPIGRVGGFLEEMRARRTKTQKERPTRDGGARSYGLRLTTSNGPSQRSLRNPNRWNSSSGNHRAMRVSTTKASVRARCRETPGNNCSMTARRARRSSIETKSQNGWISRARKNPSLPSPW